MRPIIIKILVSGSLNVPHSYRPLTQLLLLSVSPATSVPVPEVFEGVGSEHALRTASFCMIKSIYRTSSIGKLKAIKGICRTLGIINLKVISIHKLEYKFQNTITKSKGI